MHRIDLVRRQRTATQDGVSIFVRGQAIAAALGVDKDAGAASLGRLQEVSTGTVLPIRLGVELEVRSVERH